jgi:hypothetical protein
VPWDRTSGTDPKYRSKAHRDYRASLVRQLKRDGYLMCTAKTCVMPTRMITNPRGRDRDGLHAGHDDSGTQYDGPQHNACNVTDGAKRARAKQLGETANPIPTSRQW